MGNDSASAVTVSGFAATKRDMELSPQTRARLTYVKARAINACIFLGSFIAVFAVGLLIFNAVD